MAQLLASAPGQQTLAQFEAAFRGRGGWKKTLPTLLETLVGATLAPRLCATIADELEDWLLPYSIDLPVFAALNQPELQAHIVAIFSFFKKFIILTSVRSICINPIKGYAASTFTSV